VIKVLSWNIRQGGGSRVQPILNSIKSIGAAIVVLSEYRNNATGIKLRNAALALGYRFQMVSAALSDENSVIILSQFPANFSLLSKSHDPIYYHNVIKAEYDAFSVYGMYLPHKKKHTLFDFLLDELKHQTKPMIYCGDMNTGINGIDQEGDSFWYEKEMKTLFSHKMVDAFREKNGLVNEYSWYSHQGNGYRYDHTLVHRDLQPIITECQYLHEYRIDGLSDHSPMLLTLG
jgi:exodeoxyribonuclease III